MGKSGLLAAFPRAFHKTNRVLGNAHAIDFFREIFHVFMYIIPSFCQGRHLWRSHAFTPKYQR
jgi:hypothetical protein